MALLPNHPKIDEYARLRAENEAEMVRKDREEALLRQQVQSAAERRSLEEQALHFQRNFEALSGRRANAAKPRFDRETSNSRRKADFYGFYYGQL